MDEKKTINQLMEEAELTPGVWGRLIATGDHVWQEDINGDRAVANCDTEEIAVFFVCAPKAIVGLQQIAREAIARAEMAEGENINLKLELNAARMQKEIPDMVVDGYVNYVIASKAIRMEAMPFHAWLAAGDREVQP